MSPDFFLISGLILGIFAIPSALAAFADSRTPRISLALVFLSLGCLAYAYFTNPGGYTLEHVADVIYQTIGDALR